MDMTQEQIDREFCRQVRLCSGIGKERMLEIVKTFFGDGSHPFEFKRDWGDGKKDNH